MQAAGSLLPARGSVFAVHVAAALRMAVVGVRHAQCLAAGQKREVGGDQLLRFLL